MLSGPAACRAAPLRRIQAKSEAIWITDDVLSRALQRFCIITRSSQRDASSVPGPMESRRRTGKRRIAHLSEGVHIPGQDYGLPWGPVGALDTQKWHWEAPSSLQPLPDPGGTPLLPAWLREYQPVMDEDLSETSKSEDLIEVDQETSVTNIGDELRAFRESLKASSVNQVQALCDSFNQTFKQNLVLGLVSEEVLSESLQYITETIQEVIGDKSLAVSHCVSFYEATWDGITGCKVLRPGDLGIALLDKFLILLGEIYCTPAVQSLATKIVLAAPLNQLPRMRCGILTVAKSWLSYWTRPEIGYGGPVVDVTSPSHADIAMPDRLPSAESVAMFVKFLSPLRSARTQKTLHAATDHLILTCFANFRGPLKILRVVRYSWLLVVANMSCVHEDLLTSIWLRMNPPPNSSEGRQQYTLSSHQMSLHETCNMLLDHWISRGQIRKPERVRAAYMAFVQKSGKSDSAGHLMQALYQSKEHWWIKRKCLFRYLRRLGKLQAIHHTFRILVAQGLMTASCAGGEIYEMSRVDPRRALNMYKLYCKVQHDDYNTHFLLDWCPNLILSMIRSPEFPPWEIWWVLDPYPTNARFKPLHPARVRLMQRVALEFAAAEVRSPRVALRYVMECMLYLRRHRVALSADLSQALTQAGIIRSLLNGQWLGKQKAAWILDVVRKVEGSTVSQQMEQTLQAWLGEQVAKQERLQREANPLGVGSID